MDSLKHHIYTYSGKLCSVDNPPSIEDIVVSLGRIARFSGNTISDFNVMAHSIHVAYILWVQGHDNFILQGLLHDATECMFGDIPTPFKNDATRYLEKYAASNIFRSHGYDFEVVDSLVCRADKISLVLEAKELLKGDAWEVILGSILLDLRDVEEISPKFLKILIDYCDKRKEDFRPDTGYLYCSILNLINALKLIPENPGDIFKAFLRKCFDKKLSKDTKNLTFTELSGIL